MKKNLETTNEMENLEFSQMVKPEPVLEKAGENNINNKFKVKSENTIIVNGLKMKKALEFDYLIEYNTKVRMSEDELICFYNEVTEVAYQTNFGNNPYNWAAYANFKIDNEIYTISAPIYVNGDNNWYSYPKDENNKRPLIIKVFKIMDDY